MKITFRSLRQRDSDQPHEPEFTPYVPYNGGFSKDLKRQVKRLAADYSEIAAVLGER